MITLFTKFRLKNHLKDRKKFSVLN